MRLLLQWRPRKSKQNRLMDLKAFYEAEFDELKTVAEATRGTLGLAGPRNGSSA